MFYQVAKNHAEKTDLVSRPEHWLGLDASPVSHLIELYGSRKNLGAGLYDHGPERTCELKSQNPLTVRDLKYTFNVELPDVID